MQASSSSKPEKLSIGESSASKSATAQSVYAKSPTETLKEGYTVHGYLKDYWKEHGKPFLKRTLLYERVARTHISLREERRIKRKPLFGSEQFKVEGGFASQVKDVVVDPSQVADKIEWKPFATRVVFDGICDDSGKRDSMDLSVRLLRITTPGELKEEPADGKTKLNHWNVPVPRNTTVSYEKLQSITVPMADIAKPVGSSARDYLLFWYSCKLPVQKPSTDNSRPKGSERSGKPRQDMANFFGCVEMKSGGFSADENGCERSTKLKILQLETEGLDPREAVSQLESIPPNEKTPVLKFRMHQTWIRSYLRTLGSTKSLPASSYPNEPLARASISYAINLSQEGNLSDEQRGVPATGPMETTSCGFCEEQFRDTYSLLQHIRCSHRELRFVVKELPSHLLVEVRPVPFYDARLELRHSKRKSLSVGVTKFYKNVLFVRPVSKRYSKLGDKMVARAIDEFKFLPPVDPDEEEFEREREKTLRHHKRQYFHSHTLQPMKLDELDEDSEDEPDLEWQKRSMEKSIAKTNSSKAVQRFMLMWNLHMMKCKYSAKCQMGAACANLINKHGRRIIAEKLDRVFVAHMTVMQSNGVLSQTQVQDLSNRLNALKM